MSIDQELVIRSATQSDVPMILDMQARSLRRLGRVHYPVETIEALIRTGTFQPVLLNGGRYLVASLHGRIVASGGWLSGGPAAPGAANSWSATQGTAVVRAVYVDPNLARAGVGSAVMARIHTAATSAGMRAAELLATQMSVRFYSRLGYRSRDLLTIALPSGHLVELTSMHKWLVAESAAQVAA